MFFARTLCNCLRSMCVSRCSNLRTYLLVLSACFEPVMELNWRYRNSRYLCEHRKYPVLFTQKKKNFRMEQEEENKHAKSKLGTSTEPHESGKSPEDAQSSRSLCTQFTGKYLMKKRAEAYHNELLHSRVAISQHVIPNAVHPIMPPRQDIVLPKPALETPATANREMPQPVHKVSIELPMTGAENKRAKSPELEPLSGDITARIKGPAQPVKVEKDRVLISCGEEVQPVETDVSDPLWFTLELDRIEDLSYAEQLSLLTDPVPKSSETVHCTIKQVCQGFFGYFYPRYELYLLDTTRLIVTAKKLPGKLPGTYLITTDHKNLTESSEGFVGELRGDLYASQYNLYTRVPEAEWKAARENALAISYVTTGNLQMSQDFHMLGRSKPRTVAVVLPDPATKTRTDRCMARGVTCGVASDRGGLLAMYQTGVKKGLSVLKNKAPKWDPVNEVNVLDFHGRVQMASVNNFILTDKHGMEDIVLFGKAGKNEFSLDFKWPVSVLQAFAIRLCGVLGKIGGRARIGISSIA